MNYEGTINIANFRFVHRENAEKSGSYSLSNVIKAGDFRLNVSARTASVCGKELDLIEPEFDVLLLLTAIQLMLRLPVLPL